MPIFTFLDASFLAFLYIDEDVPPIPDSQSAALASFDGFIPNHGWSILVFWK